MAADPFKLPAATRTPLDTRLADLKTKDAATLTINSLAPFDATGSATVDKQTCGCTGTGSGGYCGREAVLSQFACPFSANTPECMGYSLRTASRAYAAKWMEC